MLGRTMLDVEKLEEILADCGWARVKVAYTRWEGGRFHFTHEDQWQKALSRLLVDEIGIFLYRCIDAQWVRSGGLSYDLIARHLPRKRLKFDSFTLNLLSGEPN